MAASLLNVYWLLTMSLEPAIKRAVSSLYCSDLTALYPYVSMRDDDSPMTMLMSCEPDLLPFN